MSEPGWLLVHGKNAAETKIENRSLRIFLPGPDAEHPLRILIHRCLGMRPGQFGQDTWTLPGMTFDIQTPLAAPTVEIQTDNRLGQVMEVAFPVPGSLPVDDPALVLTPRKTQRSIGKKSVGGLGLNRWDTTASKPAAARSGFHSWPRHSGLPHLQRRVPSWWLSP